ncbi:N-acetylmuramoyl-L-alanine amidase [Phormidesmis priestleyi ULC007]|uniref:N-acetylmuramoyl-L-alanine amidase n=1 Tax=Phormidesmis priestleyi ULC007 TaxID=1920490 RepID=A0A2T1DMA9_9CYAN|nr:N-acetylmuramoyl-L-alanine amidase [Phormidesmis priestleyi]PSB21601.1 N-acetylmuramoyl-L-alanine amidase [Phormidesmis priestleyi ULC007]PZO54642.1 MAG: N-acetylmuramoyl-L-alanine amidase [Phormidesmis priestleyi]
MPFTAKVITADEWDAKPPVPGTFPFPVTSPRYIIVHHTDNKNPPNDPSQSTLDGAKQFARNIQHGHFRRGWSDSGHNFLNTTGGFILEGRHGSLNAVEQGLCIRSAHAAQDDGKLAGGNDSPGIENEGNFMTFQMEQNQWDSLVELCASLCSSCQISPVNIKGHRDFSDTDCPGDWLYNQLPQLRKEVTDKLGMNLSPDELSNDRPIRSLKLGSTGEDVLQLQKALIARGFKPGAADGLFGENTRAAVIAFQRSLGFEMVDGIVGPQTRAALRL